MPAWITQLWTGAALNVLAAVLSLISLLILDRVVGRRWRADRADRLMSEALQMARVAGNPDEPEMARALATKRLAEMGYTDAWLSNHKAAARSELDALFSPVAEQENISSDASAVVRAIWFMDAAFRQAQLEARPEDDRKVRIALVMATLAIMFAFLSVATTLRSHGL